ncbi:hypothetical protein DFH06DRAFT_669202 [Mycena polygramma]|nr:hypothetical protein DFH06DRAFT_669202 [Mycena polygramma]
MAAQVVMMSIASNMVSGVRNDGRCYKASAPRQHRHPPGAYQTSLLSSPRQRLVRPSNLPTSSTLHDPSVMNLLNAGQLAVVALSALSAIPGATAAPSGSLNTTMEAPPPPLVSQGSGTYVGLPCSNDRTKCGVAVGTIPNGTIYAWSLDAEACDAKEVQQVPHGNPCHVAFSIGGPNVTNPVTLMERAFNHTLNNVGILEGNNVTIEGCGGQMWADMNNAYLTSCKATTANDGATSPCDGVWGLKMDYYCPMS